MGVFSEHAAEYAAHGLRVFPASVTGDDSGWLKKPSIKNWRKAATTRPSNFAERFPDAAIGILNDNALTVVDLDEPGLIDWAIDRFGETPIVIKTPRDGDHLWYKNNGERRQIGIEGRKVDILGTGGYAIAPPSKRPDGRSWGFLRGSPADIENLPTILSSALPDSAPPPSIMAVDGEPEIGRNNTLFKMLIREALSFNSEAELLFQATELNKSLFIKPLPEIEVTKVVRSVWGYKAKDELWSGGEARAQITASELETLGGNGNAALLLMRLRAVHGWRNGGSFALANVFAASLGWGLEKFRSAVNTLVGLSFLKRLHAGGNGPKDPPIYALINKVRESHTNITRHLSQDYRGI